MVSFHPYRSSCPVSRPINYFGIFVPKGAPPEVAQTLDKISGHGNEQERGTEKYAQSRGAMFAPMASEDTQKAVFPAIQVLCMDTTGRRKSQGISRHRRYPQTLT